MPTRQTQTRIVIPAPPDKVWAALSDLANYPRWNPALRLRLWTGSAPRVGGRAWLSLRGLPLPVVVPVTFESVSAEPAAGTPERPETGGRGDKLRLCWRGGAWGLMRGWHYFELRAVEGGTELIHGEEFRGLLVPLIWPLLEPQLDELYASINEALAAYVGS
jgi:hypothetical protein